MSLSVYRNTKVKKLLSCVKRQTKKMQPPNAVIYKGKSERQFIKMLCIFPDFLTFALSVAKL